MKEYYGCQLELNGPSTVEQSLLLESATPLLLCLATM